MTQVPGTTYHLRHTTLLVPPSSPHHEPDGEPGGDGGAHDTAAGAHERERVPVVVEGRPLVARLVHHMARVVPRPPRRPPAAAAQAGTEEVRAEARRAGKEGQGRQGLDRSGDARLITDTDAVKGRPHLLPLLLAWSSSWAYEQAGAGGSVASSASHALLATVSPSPPPPYASCST